MRVRCCPVEVRARATCTLVELCLHASMGLWGRGGEMCYVLTPHTHRRQIAALLAVQNRLVFQNPAAAARPAAARSMRACTIV